MEDRGHVMASRILAPGEPPKRAPKACFGRVPPGGEHSHYTRSATHQECESEKGKVAIRVARMSYGKE